jgi:hypothetical protein
MAMLLSVVMLLAAFPMNAFAAVASDLPDNMADHAILRALEYTGYDVQKQKDDGTLYQSGSYGSRTPAAVLSGINYGTSTSGKETVADSSTVTGRAPDIAKFQSKGLCCASFVTYFVCNYLPNIEGANTQFILDAINDVLHVSHHRDAYLVNGVITLILAVVTLFMLKRSPVLGSDD